MIIPTELEARVLWVMQGGAEWRAPSLVLQQVVPTEQAAYEILADLVEKGWVNRILKVVARANVTTYTITGAGREALTHTPIGAAGQPRDVLDIRPGPSRDEALQALENMIPPDRETPRLDETLRLPGILPDPPGYGTVTGLSEDDWSLVLTALEKAAAAQRTVTLRAEQECEECTEAEPCGQHAANYRQVGHFRALYDRLAQEEIFEFPANTRARKIGREWCRIVPGLQGRLLAFGGHGGDAYAWIDVQGRRDG